MNSIDKKIKGYYMVMLVCCILFSNCTQSDDYKKYMPDGEKIYPQKADSVKTFPGKNRIQLEWTIIDPKVTSCKVIYEQNGIQSETTVPVNTAGNYNNDTIRIIIPGLEETVYTFKIISYDDFGHTSIPVEAEETAYGEVYEQSLLNRTLKSYSFDELKGLTLEWYAAEATEIGIRLAYTDLQGVNRTMFIPNTEISTSIPDYKISEPLYYSAMYKPKPAAIDTFYTQTAEQRIPYWVNLTPDRLKNTEFPFIRGDMVSQNRYYKAVDWNYNDAGLANGNVDNNLGGTLVIIAYSTWGVGTIKDGKLFQTVELDAGTYRYDVTVAETSNPMGPAYIAVALGNELPNTEKVESEALAFVRPPTGIPRGSSQLYSLEFDLSEKCFVSLGFVVTFEPPAGTIHQVHFRKVELWEKR